MLFVVALPYSALLWSPRKTINIGADDGYTTFSLQSLSLALCHISFICIITILSQGDIVMASQEYYYHTIIRCKLIRDGCKLYLAKERIILIIQTWNSLLTQIIIIKINYYQQGWLSSLFIGRKSILSRCESYLM